SLPPVHACLPARSGAGRSALVPIRTPTNGEVSDMLDGLPDLAAPLPSTSGRVFRAFGTAGLAVAVPDRLVLQRRVDGSPVLLLTVLHGPAGTGGRFELGVTLDADLDGVGRDLLGLAEPLRVATADPEDGVLE